MRINLNDPTEFTIKNLKKLIASQDDSINMQIRVTKDGYLFIANHLQDPDNENILFCLGSFGAHNGYVGIEASKDDNWMNLLFNGIKKNRPNPDSFYIDNY